MKSSFNLKIGGHAGEGIKISGVMISRSLTRLGYSTFGYNEYPSLIRGGHNAYQIHAGIEERNSQIKSVDLLIALNQETIRLHQEELDPRSVIIYDPGEFKLPQIGLEGRYLAIPLSKIAQGVGGKPIMANVVAIGSCLALLGLPLNTLFEVIERAFAEKSRALIELNKKCAVAGKKVVNKDFKGHILRIKRPKIIRDRIVVTGNEAVALGAISGGLKLYAAYPMTPATSILHYLADKSPDADVLVKHVEDEIGAINLCLGASFAGVRTMTGTSGGGLCLMAEGITLAGISETPIVVVNSMRPGPALGMPTWTAQGDLDFVLGIGHDEYPRIVLAPGDSNEAFWMTKKSLEWAERFQLPVIIITDKYLAESDFSQKPFSSSHQNKRYKFKDVKNAGKDTPFKRYAFTADGVSRRAIPGQAGGIHCCNSYEHDEYGYGTEDPQLRQQMMDKRLKKLESIREIMPPQPIYGPKKAERSLISWGSNKNPILQALPKIKNLNFLHLNFLWPFPLEQVREFCREAKEVYCLECNATGQLGNLIRQKAGIDPERILKYNGRPFWPEEIQRIFNEQ